jgi:L-prolyl-PCP dehydrogenase
VDFAWTAEQEDLHRAAREVAEHLPLAPGASGEPNPHRFAREAWDAAAAFGLTGLNAPSAYGGLGLDLLSTAHVLEGFGEGCGELGLLFSVAAHLFACCGPIAHAATDTVKDSMLPELLTGRWVGANGMTETEAGSDVMAVKSLAVRDGDAYRITGEKTMVTNGPIADVTIIYASTDPVGGYLSLSAFAVPRETSGFVIGQPLLKTGLGSSPMCSVYLDDCTVSERNLLGGEGQGALIFQASMQTERACLVAGYLGAMTRQLSQVVQFAKDRKQFGRPIGSNQAISHRIADMKLRLEAARLLVYHACWLLDHSREAMLAVSMAKLAASEAAVQAGLDAIQISGGLGVMSDTGIDQLLRDALPSTIFSGTSEMQRDIIAARLGL